MKKSSPLTLDITIILCTLSLVVIGIFFIYSSGVTTAGVSVSREYIRQIIWAGTGLVLLFVFSFIDYKRLRDFAPYIYAFFILLLVITLIFGSVVNGAKSWLGILNFGIQPSEFMKIGTILFLSWYFHSSGKKVDTFLQFLIGFAIIVLPMGLILLQPDMGTASVYLPVFLLVSFIAGAKIRYILFFILTFLVFLAVSTIPHISAILYPESELRIIGLLNDRTVLLYALLVLAVVALIAFIGERMFHKNYFHWIFFSTAILLLGIFASFLAQLFLQDYQIMRLIIFLNPEHDPQGAGWNIIQSITAVGSGGFTGKGFLQGTQSHYQYLPQQSTDFIFSIIAEEWGFIGVFVVFAIIATLLIKCFLISIKSGDRFAVFVGTGIVGIFFFHFLINIGMAIGIMPITGIPLYFLSYGGSSLWTGMIGIGIIQSIKRKTENL